MNTHPLIDDLNWYGEITAAGFTLCKSKSYDGRDGIAWQAVLKQGKTELVCVYNEGHGGSDWMDYLVKKNLTRQQIDDRLKEFITLAPVVSRMHDNAVKLEDMSLEFASITAAEYATNISNIPALITVWDQERFCEIVQNMADAADLIKTMIRLTKTKLCWVEKNSTDIVSVKRPDSPEIRAYCKKKSGDKFYAFLADHLTQFVKQ